MLKTDWNLRCRRNLQDDEIDEWTFLSHILTSITLKPVADPVLWKDFFKGKLSSFYGKLVRLALIR